LAIQSRVGTVSCGRNGEGGNDRGVGPTDTRFGANGTEDKAQKVQGQSLKLMYKRKRPQGTEDLGKKKKTDIAPGTSFLMDSLGTDRRFRIGEKKTRGRKTRR